ncbi:uncharacterized protein LOC143634025 [Bidens hawaiensis]|uniref:uncharacterized protein LOC143634025 n=1 Tax=Bidens hawaiensis TaxID=980011 RepID=UPI004049CA24
MCDQTVLAEGVPATIDIEDVEVETSNRAFMAGQNGVVERKNMALIETARVMLADSKLPISFLSEVVASACYTLNHVLIVKKFGKTYFEMLNRRKPNLKWLVRLDHNVPFLILMIAQVQHVDCQRYATHLQRKGDAWMFDYDSLWNCFSFPEEEITDEMATLLFQQYLGEGFHEENTQDVPIFNIDPAPDVDEHVDDTPATPSFDDDGEDHNDVIESFVQPSPNSNEVISNEVISEDNVMNLPNDVVVPNEVMPRMLSYHPEESIIGDLNTGTYKQALTGRVLSMRCKNNCCNLKSLGYGNLLIYLITNDALIPSGFSSAKETKMVHQLDVKSVFLNEKLSEEVFVGQPPGFVDPIHKDKVYLLDKALYGLHQAPRAWYETLSQHLLANCFVRGNVDCTLFTKKVDGHLLIVQVYVDDNIFWSTNNNLCKIFEEVMKSKFEMRAMGELKFFLGLQVEQLSDSIFIHQTKYVNDILEKFNMDESTSISTHIPLNHGIGPDPTEEKVDETLYRSMIGSLMYLTASSPDIMYPTCLCARFLYLLALNGIKNMGGGKVSNP